MCKSEDNETKLFKYYLSVLNIVYIVHMVKLSVFCMRDKKEFFIINFLGLSTLQKKNCYWATNRLLIIWHD